MLNKTISNDFLKVFFLMNSRIFRHITIPFPINQFAIMAILSDEKSITFSEMCKRLSIMKQQLSLLIDHLEENGLVKRIPDTKDRRRIRIKMTAKGQRFINDHRNKIKDRMEVVLSTFSPEELKEVDNSLQTLMKLFGKILTLPKSE